MMLSSRSPTVSWPVFLGGAGVVLVIVFTLLQPGISAELSGVTLLMFWSAHVFAALALLQGAQVGLQRVPVFARASPVMQIIVSGAVGAVLFAPLAGVFDQIFGVAALTDDSQETLIEGVISEFTGAVGLVMVTWIGLNLTRLVQIHAPTSPTAAKTTPETPAFWDRVPPEIGRDLVGMSAELHYLRVYTTTGQALVLYSFGQAMTDLKGVVKGVQIHRSHWVARAHIVACEPRGKGAICTLSTGLELPVSRSRKSGLDIGN